MEAGKRWTRPAIAIVAIVAVVGGASLLLEDEISETTITLQFTEAKGLYKGDKVTIRDVPVGKVTDIEPNADHVDVEVVIEDDVTVPADVKAVLVAPSLVSVRRIELAVDDAEGPPIKDGAVVPVSRTATPVEWDEVKTQLVRLTEALGPNGANKRGALDRVLRVSADNLAGQGANLNRTIAALSEAMNTLADGGGDMFATVRNLQVFATALEQSEDQIVTFNRQFASVTGSLAADDKNLERALDGLAQAFPEIQEFIKNNRGALTSAVEELLGPAKQLADHRQDIADVLQVAPGAVSNFYNIMDPDIPGPTGTFALVNFSNAAEFICGATLSLGGTADQCRQFLAPVAQYLNLGAPPIGLAPLIRDDRDNVEPPPGSEDERTNADTADVPQDPTTTGDTGNLVDLVESLLGGAG